MEMLVEWIGAHKEIFVAVLGALCVAIGYWFRLRTERRQNLREALHLLLEIWHRVGVLTARSPHDSIDVLATKISERFPGITMSPGEVAATKAHFVPILLSHLRALALEDVDTLQKDYLRAVSLIARSHPVYAYRLEASARIKHRLQFLDGYLADAYAPLEQQGGTSGVVLSTMRDRLAAYVHEDQLQDIEDGLRGLALRVSLLTWIEVRLLIRKRRQLLATTPDREVGEYVDSVIVPVLSDPSVAAAMREQSRVASETSP